MSVLILNEQQPPTDGGRLDPTIAVPTLRQTDADLLSMVAKVKSGQYTAMINDVLTMRYLANSDPDCELQLLGEPFEPFHNGITFALDAEQWLIDTVDK